MNERPAPPMRQRRLSPRRWIALGLLAVALVGFVRWVHPFLAVTQRVDGDILVIEGWIPPYMLPAAATEFQQGKYSLFLVSGLENDPAEGPAAPPPDATRTATGLAQLGVPRDALVACPAPFARWRRTAKTAQAVRDKIAVLGLKPRGINVVTAGPHARETWVAYQHIFGESMPVGIISIPKNNYPADRWWLSSQGLIWVPKDFVAWLKELLIGTRN